MDYACTVCRAVRFAMDELSEYVGGQTERGYSQLCSRP